MNLSKRLIKGNHAGKNLASMFPAGTRRPGEVPRRSPKGPNIWDLQGIFRGLLGDQHKN